MSNLVGPYEIPSQTTIDLVIGEMYTDEGQPTAGMNKLARDIEGAEDGAPMVSWIEQLWP